MNLPGMQILEVEKHYFCENPDFGDEVMRCELLALNPEMTHALVHFLDPEYDNTVISAAHELIQPCGECGDNPRACGHGNKPG
jgi:hypothetical protein